MLLRRLLAPTLALCAAAGAVLSCSDGTTDPVAELRGDCAAPWELSSMPPAVAGEWWTDGDSPPTLSLAQDGAALRGTLSFSGVQRAGGTGSIDGGCLRLTFPPRPNALEPALVVDGRLLSGGVLRVALRAGGDGTPTTYAMQRVRR